MNKNRKRKKFELSSCIINICCVLIALVCIYPFWHVYMYSFSDSRAAMSGGIFLWPREFSTVAWESVLKTKQLYVAYKNTILKTVLGTGLSIVLSCLTAYPLSLPYFKGRRFLQAGIFFTMLFEGGMIPTYLLIRDLGLLDTIWVYIFPGALSAYNLFILRNFFKNIPDSLMEAAMIDGASHMQVLLKVVIPLSKAAIATQVMFYGVANWNSYMDGVLYVNDSKLELLQVYLRKRMATAADLGTAANLMGSTSVTEDSIKMAVIGVTILPIIILYLCLQKYFVKGTMVGSVKG